MDERFPNWLSTLIRRLSFLAIPNLAILLTGLAVIAFAANIIMPADIGRFILDPDKVREGEWWRLFTFVFTGGVRGSIFFLFYVLYLYFVTNTLDEYWGSASLTVYLLFGYLTTVAMAFVLNRPIDVSYYLIEYLTLAFGTLFPDYTLNLYGIIPIKAKWFAWLAGFFIILAFAGGDLLSLLCIPLAFFPYLIFFGEILVTRARRSLKTRKNRQRFDKDMWR